MLPPSFEPWTSSLRGRRVTIASFDSVTTITIKLSSRVGINFLNCAIVLCVTDASLEDSRISIIGRLIIHTTGLGYQPSLFVSTFVSDKSNGRLASDFLAYRQLIHHLDANNNLTGHSH